MMDYTDRHMRYLHRLISPHVRLYTEMIHARALLYGNRDRLLAFDPAEKYVALQLGGNQPKDLAQAAQIAAEAGYDEINLNVGCPSSRVSAGKFGACLMLEPLQVADCIDQMQSAVKVPVTIKCRIGVDQQDSYEALHYFIQQNDQAGAKTFIIHARKAWLSGLSPKQNRTIPPLHYAMVQQVKKDFPHLTIILNGGIDKIAAIEEHESSVDGIMIGRAAVANPYLLAEIETHYFKNKNILSRIEIVDAYLSYVDAALAAGTHLYSLIRPLLNLFQGQRGANLWRNSLCKQACQAGRGSDVIRDALLKIIRV